MTQPQTLADTVAGEIRATMARQRVSAAVIAKALGKSPMYVSRRLSGDVPFDLADLERVVSVLGVQVADLLPARGRAA